MEVKAAQSNRCTMYKSSVCLTDRQVELTLVVVRAVGRLALIMSAIGGGWHGGLGVHLSGARSLHQARCLTQLFLTLRFAQTTTRLHWKPMQSQSAN